MHALTETIPNDLITNVVAKVASSFLSDLCNLKQSCKTLYELGEDNMVFSQASMDKLPPVPWILSDEAAFFLERCQQTGNPEALYRLGMVEYFTNVRLELGRAVLARAAYLGHVVAKYVLGIILICTDIHSRSQGMELLYNVELEGRKKRSTHNEFVKCREKVKCILDQMWRNHFIHLEERMCSNSNCKKNTRVSSTGWVSRDTYTEEFDNKKFECLTCTCDFEVELLCKMLST